MGTSLAAVAVAVAVAELYGRITSGKSAEE